MDGALTEPSALFELREVTFGYAQADALYGLTFSVHSGDRLAVLGANGSGKSTLLRLLDALIFRRQGDVKFCGSSLTEDLLHDEDFAFDFRRRVALLFQNPEVQLFNPTVFDEIAFGPLQLRWPRDAIRERVATTMDEMQLTHLQSRAPHRLSNGEKKRVALASVLVLEPDVLLLDEPTAGLDPSSQSHVIDCLIAWKGTRTIVTATHDLDIVEDIADRCCVLEGGRAAAMGSPGDILYDEDLLRRTHLIHTHRHHHRSGLVHAHPHVRRSHEHSPKPHDP
jgi:cobalt/nickel transport system ATP-binding protein